MYSFKIILNRTTSFVQKDKIWTSFILYYYWYSNTPMLVETKILLKTRPRDHIQILINLQHTYETSVYIFYFSMSFPLRFINILFHYSRMVAFLIFKYMNKTINHEIPSCLKSTTKDRFYILLKLYIIGIHSHVSL